MLKSKFAKKKQGFQAQKIFTDRVEPTAVFYNSISEIEDKTQELIVYYGKGGIGKSTLLKNLIKHSEEAYKEAPGKTFHNIFVSLDAYEYSNPVNILMSIRNGVIGDCSLFDYALMQYFAKTKMTIEEMRNKGNLFSHAVMDILNDVVTVGTAQVCVPAAALNKCINLIKDMRFKERYKEEMQEISELNEFELFERLPYYLGICISYAAEKGHYHVIFMDSYESVLARTVGGTPSVDKEDWLKELFLSCEPVRVVIASRDRIRWDKEDEEWNDYLNQHLIYNLSEEDSRWFLQQVPIYHEDVVEAIVKNAGGVPLYLDMCVDIYEKTYNADEKFEIETLQKGEKIIDRYIRHLSQKNKYAVKVLSMTRSFDMDFAQKLLQKQKLVYNKEELKELFEKSIILPIEEKKGLWKLDTSVSLHLNQKMEKEQRKEIFDDMLECVIEDQSGRSFVYFAMLIERATQEPEFLDGVIEQMIEEIDFYSNAGFWNELHVFLKDYVDNCNDLLKTVAVMEELIWYRRTGQLKQAETFAKEYPLKKEDLGSWFYLYEYLKIQIRHLMGYYEESIQGYKKLVDEMNLIRNLIPAHIYNTISMKYADILFLKGQFDESLKIVESMLDKSDTPLVDQIELLRIKGHIFRFQKQYVAAELIYRSILKLLQEEGLRAYEGKLYTNMTEALCMTNPDEALEWFEKSVQENSRMGNDIELGKAQAAASAAMTNKHEFDEAVHMGKQAVITAEKTGYKSGRAFGLAALCYAYKMAGNPEKEAEIAEELKRQIAEIGVYQYIV